MSKKKKQLLIIDAHALIHRAYHALPPLTTKDGNPIGAVYGFLLILMSALRDLQPAYVAVTFDSKGKTFRNELYPEYKANREAPDAELVSQFPLVEEAVKTFNFPVYRVAGYEADDLIGTICEQYENTPDIETIILTGDLDMLQLVDSNTKVMKLHKGVKDTVLYDEELVIKMHGYTPEQVTDYKGLRGDASDNIPGVKGIGEKGAVVLLQEYGTIENIFDHLNDITGRNKKPLEAAGAKESAMMSKQLATIAKNSPITFSIEDAKVGVYNQKDRTKITELFKKYEFKTLLTQLNTLPGFGINEGLFAPKKSDKEIEEEKAEEAAKTAAVIQRNAELHYTLVQDAADLKKLAAALSEQNIFAFDTETTGLNPHKDNLVGISFSWKEKEGWYLPCGMDIPKEIVAVMEDSTIKKTGHNSKFDMEVLHHAGVHVQGVTYDTMIASYLMNEGRRGNGLDNLALVEFGHEMQPISELIGKGKNQITMAEVPVEDASWYACEDADFSWRLYKRFAPKLRDSSFATLMHDIEMPLIPVLAEMEQTGIKLDVAFLHDMSKKLHRRIKTVEKNIQKEGGGGDFNVASPAQLSVVLFETLELPTTKIKKTQTGFSTAASELEKLRGTHVIIEMIEEFRELSKLTGTYIDALPRLINPQTGRVHTSFNQTIAATGRLSSTDPNLQNIPIRTELGREIRKAFIPEKGHSILAIDYSQIELRVVAHLADDPVMKKAFMNGEDIHTRTAAELHDVKIADVTKEMRRQAKAINFGILYGMGVQGIMRDSGVSRDEARFFYDKYFSIHSGISDYIEKTKSLAHQNGYAESPFGRRRAMPEIQGTNRMLIAAAERAAINMPVQGMAAELIKIAMIKVQEAINTEKIAAKMLLQVHDELVFEVKTADVAAEAKKIQHIMENAYELSVPLTVDVEVGKNWGELERI